MADARRLFVVLTGLALASSVLPFVHDSPAACSCVRSLSHSPSAVPASPGRQTPSLSHTKDGWQSELFTQRTPTACEHTLLLEPVDNVQFEPAGQSLSDSHSARHMREAQTMGDGQSLLNAHTPPSGTGFDGHPASATDTTRLPTHIQRLAFMPAV